jgi:5-enolpyruvylshikimate-3-phosphate synthase
VIEDAECVYKSYPSFFEDLKRLGADLEVESG